MSAKRRVAFALAALTMVSLPMLLVAEVLLRLAAPQPASWLDVYRRHPELPFFTLLPNVDTLVDTGETHWTLFTDAEGFRVSAADAKKARQEQRWGLLLGDSFAFGHGVDYVESFAHHVEAAVPGRLVNAAVPGYGPPQYRQVLDYLLRRRETPPELLLVVSFLGNDIHDCGWNKDVPVSNGVIGDPGGLKSTIKRSSHLYRLLAKVHHAVMPQQEDALGALTDAFEPASWKTGGALHAASRTYAEEVARIARIAEQRGIPLLLVVIPTREAVDAARGELKTAGLDYGAPRDFVQREVDALGVRWLDLTPVLATRPTGEIYYTYDGHLTPEGNRLAADAIREALKRP